MLLLLVEERRPNSSVNLWELSGKYQGDIKQSDGISARNVRRTGHWPNGIVPYTINVQFSKSHFSMCIMLFDYFFKLLAKISKEHSSMR